MSAPPAEDHDALVRRLLDELEGAERETVDRWSDLDAGERRRLERLDVEVLGSLARSLPLERPRADSRSALLAAVSAAPVVDLGSRRRLAAPAAGPRWLLPLAAALTAVALGVAGLLWTRAGGQGEQLAALEAVVGVLRERTAGLAGREREARAQLALVGSPGVSVCPLRRRAASPLGGEPFGVLYVAADHQHWYLAVHGLVPCPEGRVYQVWFVAPAGPVSAGTFSPESGAVVELSSPTMPEGTRAVRITLEPEGGVAVPSGPEILFGDEPMQIL